MVLTPHRAVLSIQGGDVFYVCMHLIYFIKKVCNFIYFERETGGGAEREGERIPSSFCTVSTEPDVGFELMDREIMTCAETKSQMLN